MAKRQKQSAPALRISRVVADDPVDVVRGLLAFFDALYEGVLKKQLGVKWLVEPEPIRAARLFLDNEKSKKAARAAALKTAAARTAAAANAAPDAAATKPASTEPPALASELDPAVDDAATLDTEAA